jgi:hypothetical protein
VKSCPSCNQNTAKLRTGSLGEIRGVWCTNCGHSLESEEAWESAYRYDPNHVWGGSSQPVISEIQPASPTTSARKMFNSRKHGPLYQACPGVDCLPLIDVDAIPAENLSMVLDYFFGETWSEHANPRLKRDRIRELVT